MICEVCRSVVDHPSNDPFLHTAIHENRYLLECEPDCCCQGKSDRPVESLYDAGKVDIEWVRSRRITNS